MVEKCECLRKSPKLAVLISVQGRGGLMERKQSWCAAIPTTLCRSPKVLDQGAQSYGTPGRMPSGPIENNAFVFNRVWEQPLWGPIGLGPSPKLGGSFGEKLRLLHSKFFASPSNPLPFRCPNVPYGTVPIGYNGLHIFRHPNMPGFIQEIQVWMPNWVGALDPADWASEFAQIRQIRPIFLFGQVASTPLPQSLELRLNKRLGLD